jgi:hypothetical protein
MFLRYTHLGVGHPVTLRKIVKQCFGSDSTLADTMIMDVDEGEITGAGQKDGDLSEESEGEYDEEEEEEEELEEEDDETFDLDECDDVTGEEVENEFSF